MTQTASRVLRTLCPLPILPLALQSHPLRATPLPRRWLHLLQWQPSNRQQRCLHRISLNVLLLLILNTPNRRPSLKRLTYNGRCPRRHRPLLNQISDRTNTSGQHVHLIPRRMRREVFSINLCTNRLVQTDPVAFNGPSSVGSLVQLVSRSMFYVK